MNARSDRLLYRLAGLEIDPLRGCLVREGQERYLRPKTLQVLIYLIQQRQRLVSKEELMEQLWKDTAVTDDALVQCIVELRRALGDDPQHPCFIKTFPKVGYRFIGQVEELRCDHPAAVEIEEVTTVEFEVTDEAACRVQAVSSFPPALPALLPARWPPRKLAFASGLAVMLLAVMGLALSLGQRLWLAERPPAEATLLQAPEKKPVMVMYFENRSGSRELDWLREGLAEMLITNLSRSKRLTVLSRQQLYLVLERMGRRAEARIRLDEAREIARRFQVEALVLGSFAQLGEKVRIDAALHDARTGQLLAAESLLAEQPEQIFSQVDLLSLKLASHLGAEMSEAEGKPQLAEVMTDNLKAYRYYSLALERAQGYHSTEAIALLERAVALDPQFAMAYARIGYIYVLVRVNEVEKAKPYLERAFQLAHRLTDKDRLYIQAWYALAHNDKEAAIRRYRELVLQYPLEVESYWRLGWLLGFVGRQEGQLAVYQRGLAIDPEAKEIYNQLGFVYSEQGHYNEAIAAHKRYVELAPAEPNAHDSLGMTYTEAGRYEEAIAELKRALELKPNFHFAIRHLGDVYFHLGRYRDAQLQYQRYFEVAPSDWDRAHASHLLVRLHLARRDFVRAERAARQELKNCNDFGGSLLVALQRGDLKAAEHLHIHLLGNRPGPQPAADRAKVHAYLLGLYAFKTGRTDQALAHFKESQRIYWNIDTTIDSLAQAYLELGRLDEAIAEYERLAKINPNWARAQYYLGQAYERKGERERARAAYERFLHIWKEADADLLEVIEAKARLAN